MGMQPHRLRFMPNPKTSGKAQICADGIKNPVRLRMGGSAYSYLSDVAYSSRQHRPLRGVYAELSAKFQRFVYVLAEVGENSHYTQERLKAITEKAFANSRLGKSVNPDVAP